MMKRIIILLIINSLFISIYSSQKLKGRVFHINENKDTVSLGFAQVYWDHSKINTQTNDSGFFEIEKPQKGHLHLAVSYVGFKLFIQEIEKKTEFLNVILIPDNVIEEVIVNKRTEGTVFSTLKPIKTEMITQAGLQKLACCNLSESFQNNASVDVGYADAVTGARQIQMLGLSGIYSQLLFENLPSMRGLAVSNSMSYIPGSWMESIQISKGSSSVINGYESVTGQINVEFKKPEDSPIVFANIYGGDNSRLELNTNVVLLNDEHLNGMLLTHVSGNFKPMDENGDMFVESPLQRQVNLYNRWKIVSHNDQIEQQFGIRYFNDFKQGGQMDYRQKSDMDKGIYGFASDINNLQIYSKTGIALDTTFYNSIALYGSYNLYNNDAYYGRNEYIGQQHNVNYNLVYQTHLFSEDHSMSSGIGINYDNINQSFNDSAFNSVEYVPGIFSQYTWMPNEKTSAIIGLRYDYHSQWGWFLIPRVHIKHEPFWGVIFRASLGRGLHTAHVLAENQNLLVNSRIWRTLEQPELEKAWNTGINVTKKFELNQNRSIQWSADFYHTKFDNQVIVDIDAFSNAVQVYNLDGRSYSNAFQTDIILQPSKGLEITAAYRINDVKQTLHGELKSKPFVVKHRGLVSFSYASKFKKWQFDITSQFNGRASLPQYIGKPYSPIYINLISQITRRFKSVELYVGGENLTNFVQDNPVVSPHDPFSSSFDASMVWGPVMGRMFYGGLRYTLK